MSDIMEKTREIIFAEEIPGFRDRMADEPEWLFNMRREGWKKYFSAELPSRVGHLWRYTDSKVFAQDNMIDLLGQLHVSRNGDQKELPPGYAAFGYTKGNGQNFGLVDESLTKKGVLLMDLFEAASSHQDLVQNHLGKLIGPDYGKFEGYNYALWNTGFLLYVPKNVTIENPVYLHRHPTGTYTTTQLLVIVEENAEVTLVDNYSCHCEDDKALVSGITEIFAGENSRVNYVQMQKLPGSHRYYQTSRAKLDRDSKMTSSYVSFGGKTGKSDIGVDLAGEGAESNMYGMLLGDNRQHFDHHTVHLHSAGNTQSDLNFKVALDDESVSAYTGLIRIEEHAKNCEAFQENRNLLLSPDAKADSIPELEIINDEVSCSHGVTVGQIDDDMLFYLKSRGVDQAEAVNMIVQGFYNQIIDKLPDSLKVSTAGLLQKKLSKIPLAISN